MIEIELDHLTVAELIDLLKSLPKRSIYLDDALLTLQDVYDNAAEEYWTNLWSGQ